MISGYWIPSANPKITNKSRFVRFDHISGFTGVGPTDAEVGVDIKIFLLGGYVMIIPAHANEDFLYKYKEWMTSRASRYESLENVAVTIMEIAGKLETN